METFLPAACWSKLAFPQCWHWCSSFCLGWGWLPPPRPHGDTVQVCALLLRLSKLCSPFLLTFDRSNALQQSLELGKSSALKIRRGGGAAGGGGGGVGVGGAPLQQKFFFLIQRDLLLLAAKCSAEASRRSAFCPAEVSTTILCTLDGARRIFSLCLINLEIIHHCSGFSWKLSLNNCSLLSSSIAPPAPLAVSRTLGPSLTTDIHWFISLQRPFLAFCEGTCSLETKHPLYILVVLTKLSAMLCGLLAHMWTLILHCDSIVSKDSKWWRKDAF